MNFLGGVVGALGWLGSCLRRNDEWVGLGGGEGAVLFAEALLGFAGQGFGAAALGAALLGTALLGLGWGLAGVVSGKWLGGWLRGGRAIWSGGWGVVSFGQFCQAVFSLVQRVVGRFEGLVGGCEAGQGGGFEFGGGEAVLAQQVDHECAVLAVEPDDVVGGDLTD